VSTTRILYWCGAYNGLFAIVGNLLLQKWGISFATLAYFILQHISKGRVEKLVDYVKDNFASNRIFHNIDRWNEDCLKWLRRRQVHAYQII
jgi:hypothetical protein